MVLGDMLKRGRMMRLAISLSAGLLAIGAMPAHADVKDGVDAWSRGDYDTAVAQWQGPAAKGDPDAMFNMGQAYKLGRGVPQNLAKAEDFYRRAAQKGHIRAADNYGVLLFQSHRQAEALPWLSASAERGEPRALYILGIATYNGEFVPKDPVRAYALMTRAAGTGLAPAMTSLASMNATMPLNQRQMGAALAEDMDRKTTATRAREMSAADLGSKPVAPGSTGTPSTAAVSPIERAAVPAAAPRPVRADGAATAGADFANPVTLPPRPSHTSAATAKPEIAKPAPTKPATAKPAPPPSPVKQTAVAKAAPKPTAPAKAEGTWRIQLGAFGQKSNADALWAKVHARPEVAGHPRIDEGSGLSRLQAGGYSQAQAEHACTALKAAGLTCLVTAH